MDVNRRDFLKIGTSIAGAIATSGAARAEGVVDGQAGCLVDTTLCIGCRKCEQACNRRNSLPAPDVPFTDREVFRHDRRPTAKAFTVVNEYAGSPSRDQPSTKQTYAKVQCMHCLQPACVSACIVGALTRAADGAVVYNRKICIGCRYCMVACPFQVPAYEYDDPITPRVRKCQFCADAAGGGGGGNGAANPACAAACPTEALVFGHRTELLALARDRLKTRPDRYLPHIYGETEVGGTSWLYLTGRPTREVGLLDLPGMAPPEITESIQHGIFRFGIIPVLAYGILGAIMWRNSRKTVETENEGGEQ